MDSIFKVGDVVRIRDLNEIESKYGRKIPFGIVAEMKNMKGDIYVISEVNNNFYDVEGYEHLKYLRPDGYQYILAGDKGEWKWSSPMLELVASAKLYDVFTKDMAERAREDYKDTLEYVTSRLGFKRPTTTPSDEKKLELKVKNVRKVKLNFKN